MMLVTGATGNIGTHVVRDLRRRGMAVRAFVRDPEKGRRLLDEDVELSVGDFAEPETIRRAMTGVEAVFLLSANDPRQVEYEIRVIDAAAEAGVRKLVKVSTLGAEAGSPLPGFDWHGRIEDHLRRSGVPAVLLRPAFYMTNVFAGADEIRSHGQLFAPAGEGRAAMIHPRDVAAVAGAVLTADGHDGRTYALTGPEAISYREVAAELTLATGRAVEYVDVPETIAREGMVRVGLPEWLVEQVLGAFRLIRGGALTETSGEIRTLIGREALPFRELAREYARFFVS